MLKTLLIPDVHGDAEAAERLMRTVGALDERYERTPGWRIVHMGDLLDGRKETRALDSTALGMVEDGIIDILLIGNHEYPYLGGIEFYGFHFDHEIADRLRALKDDGRLKAAHAIGNKLITHAGVTPYWGKLFGWRDAYTAAKDMNRLLHERPFHSLFAQLGKARGGMSATGGILWSDFEEPRYPAFNQIHGHTFVGPKLKYDLGTANWTLVLDNGGGKFATRLAGAIVEGNEVTVVQADPGCPEFVTPLFDIDAMELDEIAA